MMKNKNKGYIILGLLFVMLSIIAFIIPTTKTETFWTAYVYTVIAFIVQIPIWKIAFGKEDTLKSKFLGVPIVHIGVVYLIIQVIAFIVFISMPTLPVWSVIVVCTILLGVSVICMIVGDVGRGEIERVEVKVQKKVFFIRNTQADVELLIESETDSDIKTALQLLAEKIRFSDPMSNAALAEVENAITDEIAKLKIADDKMTVIETLNSLITERNKKCKILK